MTKRETNRKEVIIIKLVVKRVRHSWSLRGQVNEYLLLLLGGISREYSDLHPSPNWAGDTNQASGSRLMVVLAPRSGL